MKKTLILFLTFLPLNLLGQDLECCKSVDEVGTHLNGYWKLKNSNLKKQLRFEFIDGIGKFWKYKLNDDDVVLEIEEIKQTLEVFETKSGFELDWSNGNRLGTSKIKTLNTTSLVFVRRDGKETEYYRILE